MKLFCYRLNSYRSLTGRMTCWEGVDCPFEHDWADVDLCELWARKICTRPQDLCEMRHFYFEGEREKLKEKRNKDVKKKASAIQICSKWLEGKCWGRGCQYRHYYTEDDAPITIQQDENCPSTSVQFTSPYVVKMRKEKETRRLEEVDLDTGRRRSWLETTEHDVVDLTGETPVKARTPLSSLRVKSMTNIEQDSSLTPVLVEKLQKSPLMNLGFSFPTNDWRENDENSPHVERVSPFVRPPTIRERRRERRMERMMEWRRRNASLRN